MAIKKKAKTSKQLKRLLWATFSEAIRLRYATKDGLVKCVTCGVKRKWNDGMQAGHFIPGRHNGVLFEETNVHPQCVGCNVFGHGNLIPYYQFMEETYGRIEIKRLQKLDQTIVKHTKEWYEERINHYKEEVKAYAKRKGRVKRGVPSKNTRRARTKGTKNRKIT